jgi:hypothetical protein
LQGTAAVVAEGLATRDYRLRFHLHSRVIIFLYLLLVPALSLEILA